MTAPVGVTVRGTPAPQGSKKHVGHGVMVESSKKVKPWRQDVKAAFLRDDQPIASFTDGPLAVHIVFTLAKPLSAPKRRRTWPQRKPDLDKLIRSTLDGIGEAGIWRDDAQVVELTAVKAYPGEHELALSSPGARITVRPLTPEPPCDGRSSRAGNVSCVRSDMEATSDA